MISIGWEGQDTIGLKESVTFQIRKQSCIKYKVLEVQNPG